MATPNPNDLIAKGPVSAEEAANVRRVEHETITITPNEPASEASPIEDKGSSKPSDTIENIDDRPVDFSAFDKIIDRDKHPELAVEYEKLKKEEAVAKEDKGDITPEEAEAAKKAAAEEPEDSPAAISAAAKLLSRQKAAKREEKGEAGEGDREIKVTDGNEESAGLPPTARPIPTKSGTTTVGAYTDEELAAIDPALPGFAKKMDKTAREFVVARLRAAKEQLSNRPKGIDELPPSWYEAEDAYTLTPQYKSGVGELNQLQSIEAHYKDQLAKIQNGETKWVDIVKGNDGTLQTVEKEVVPTNMGQVSVLLSTRLNRTNLLIAEKSRALDNLSLAFRQTAQNGKQMIKQLENHFFPQYSDPEVTKNDPAYSSIKQVLDSKGLGNNILAELYSKLYAFSIEVQKENETLKKAGAGQSKPTNRSPGLQDINGATSSSNGGRPKNFADAPVDFDAFERIKEGIR